MHADALGTTRMLTSTAGATTDTYLLDAWGNPVASTGTTVNPFKWVGRYGYYTDSATGLVYVRARMYQPTTARWICKDPIGLIAGPNLFAYLMNATLQYIDPSGLAWGYPGCTIDPECVNPSGGVANSQQARVSEVRFTRYGIDTLDDLKQLDALQEMVELLTGKHVTMTEIIRCLAMRDFGACVGAGTNNDILERYLKALVTPGNSGFHILVKVDCGKCKKTACCDTFQWTPTSILKYYAEELPNDGWHKCARKDVGIGDIFTPESLRLGAVEKCIEDARKSLCPGAKVIWGAPIEE